MANFQAFAKSYSTVVDALVNAGPFGAGHLVWGVFSIAVTVRTLKVNVLGSKWAFLVTSHLTYRTLDKGKLRANFLASSRLSRISTIKSKQFTKYVQNPRMRMAVGKSPKELTAHFEELVN